jgi:hypothetical protein
MNQPKPIEGMTTLPQPGPLFPPFLHRVFSDGMNAMSNDPFHAPLHAKVYGLTPAGNKLVEESSGKG